MKLILIIILIVLSSACLPKISDTSQTQKPNKKIFAIINPKITDGSYDPEIDPIYVEVPGLPRPKGFQNLDDFDICKDKNDLISALNISTNYLMAHPYGLQFAFPLTKKSNLNNFIRPYKKTYEEISHYLDEIQDYNCKNIVLDQLPDLWIENSIYFIDNLFYAHNRSNDFLDTNNFKQTLEILSDSHKYGTEILMPNNIPLQEQLIIDPLISNLVRLEASMMDKFLKINQTVLATDFNEKTIHDFRINLVKIILNQEKISPIVASFFIGKALLPYLEKLENVIRYQDIRCKMQKDECLAQITQTPLFKTLDLFASILDKDQYLNKYKLYANDLPQELVPFFLEIRKKEASFLNITDYIKNNQFSQNILNQYAGGLLSIAKKSKEYIENARKGGLFSGKNINEINFLFSEETYDKALSLLEEYIKNLDNAINKNIAEKKEILEEHSHIIEIDKLKSKFINDIRYQEQIVFNKGQEIRSLQKIIKEDRRMLSEYLLNFNEIVTRVDAQKKSLGIDISIREVSLTPKTEGNIDLSKDRESYIFAEKGDLLTFQVKGGGIWSPVCALKRDGISSHDLANARIGPDGLSIRFTKGRAVIETISDSTVDQKFAEKIESHRYCSEYFTRPNGALQKGTNTSDSICSMNESGVRLTTDHTKTKTSNDQINSEMLLNTGYRSPYSPLPSFPAGSALILEMNRHETDFKKAKRTFVLNGITSIVATDDSDYYLVVNDCADEINQQSEPLSVIIKKGVSESQLAPIFKEKLLLAINQISKKSSLLIEGGQLTGVEIDRLYTDIENQFFQLTDGNDIYKNEIFKGLFSIIIKSEISVIERKSRIVSLAKTVEEETIKLNNLYSELDRLDSMKDFYTKVQFFLMNINFSPSLNREYHDFVENLSLIFPLLEHNSPGILKETILNYDKTYKDSIELDLLGQVNQIKNLSKKIIQKTKSNQLLSTKNNDQIIIYSIPKTDIKAISEESIIKYFQDIYPYYNQIDYSKAVQLWSALYQGSVFDFNLDTNDILTGDISGLPLYATYPIIKSMAIYFVMPSKEFDKVTEVTPLIRASVDRKCSYYFNKNHKEDFIISSDRLRHFLVKPIMGKEDDMYNLFEKWGQEAGRGLSPFSIFKFDFKGFLTGKKGKNILESAMEVRILFKISYRDDVN